MNKNILYAFLLVFLLGISNTLFAQDSWSPVDTTCFSQTTSGINDMATFNGKIYAGLGNSTATLWTSASGDSGTWQKDAGFSVQHGETGVSAITTTTSSGGYIYVGTFNASTGGYVYMEPTGNSAFTITSSGTNGIDNGSGSVSDLVISGDSVFATTLPNYPYTPAQIYRCSVGTVDAWQSKFSLPSSTALRINGMTAYNNNIYVITDTSAIVYKSTDMGNTWVQDASVTRKFGNNNNTSFSAIGVYKNAMYIGTTNTLGGAQLWMTLDGVNWNIVSNNAFGNSSMETITHIDTAYGNIWVCMAATNQQSPGMIYRSTDGVNFMPSGSIGYSMQEGYGGKVTGFGPYNYYSTQYSTYDGQLWRTCIPPTVSYSLSAATICQGDSITFSNATTGATTYKWVIDNTLYSTAFNPTPYKPATAGAHVVKLIASNGACSDSMQVSITVNAKPTITFTGTTNLCPSSNTSIVASGGTSYLWNTGSTSSTIIVTPPSPGTYTYYVTVTNSNGCTNNDSIKITETTAPATAVTKTDVTCNAACDGTAKVTATGNAPFVYYWNYGPNTDSVSSLCAGSYTCTVTDANGCNANQPVTITQPTPISGNVSVTNPQCYGLCNGSATVSPSGGTGAFTYNWSSSSTTATANNLCAGTYTCTVTDSNGCAHTMTATITQPAAMVATNNITNASCTGNCDGSATVNISGGTSPYSYTWTPAIASGNSASGLCSGLYMFHVTDGYGCSLADSVVIGTNDNDSIQGVVSYNSGPVTAAKVYLFLYDTVPGIMNKVDSTTVNASLGTYLFKHLQHNKYIVEVMPDTSVYPGMIPTYYTSTYRWDSATVVSTVCQSIVTANVSVMQPSSSMGTGPGTISGTVTVGNANMKTDAQGDPIPGVDVSLEQIPGGSIMASVPTDTNGFYEFTGIPLGQYEIFTDMTGMPMDSTYDISIVGADVYNNKNFVVDSNAIVIPTSTTTGISQINNDGNWMVAYPNPYSGTTTIKYRMQQAGHIKLDLYDVLGKKIKAICDEDQGAGVHKVILSTDNKSYPSGIYFVKAIINNQSAKIIRLIKMN